MGTRPPRCSSSMLDAALLEQLLSHLISVSPQYQIRLHAGSHTLTSWSFTRAQSIFCLYSTRPGKVAMYFRRHSIISIIYINIYIHIYAAAHSSPVYSFLVSSALVKVKFLDRRAWQHSKVLVPCCTTGKNESLHHLMSVLNQQGSISKRTQNQREKSSLQLSYCRVPCPSLHSELT